MAADPKYINPYRGLIQLAQRERDWPELMEASEKLLALNPVSFPEAWFSNAISQYGQGNCAGKRATPDVSLDADPASGLSVYDGTRYQGQKGWWVVGGTSASSPMIAARAAAAGTVVNSAYVYGTSINYRDITTGNNGESCLVGYDLVTGRGSWTH